MGETLAKERFAMSQAFLGQQQFPSELLQVVAVHSYNKTDELCDVFYWCDICSIRRGEKMTCERCGGLMELREVPVKK